MAQDRKLAMVRGPIRRVPVAEGRMVHVLAAPGPTVHAPGGRLERGRGHVQWEAAQGQRFLRPSLNPADGLNARTAMSLQEHARMEMTMIVA